MIKNQSLFIFNENSHLEGIMHYNAALNRFSDSNELWKLNSSDLVDEDKDPLEKDENDYLEDELEEPDQEDEEDDSEEYEYDFADDELEDLNEEEDK